MAISKIRVSPSELAEARPPIEYVTENGFSIVRLSEISGLATDTAQECRFLVRSPRGWEREISVEFEEGLIALIQRQRRILLPDTSVFWLNCAERCLATYLWESDGYPSGGQLTISELSNDDLLLAKHWRD
jgi:hypothetical protein